MLNNYLKFIVFTPTNVNIRNIQDGLVLPIYLYSVCQIDTLVNSLTALINKMFISTSTSVSKVKPDRQLEHLGNS